MDAHKDHVSAGLFMIIATTKLGVELGWEVRMCMSFEYLRGMQGFDSELS